MKGIKRLSLLLLAFIVLWAGSWTGTSPRGIYKPSIGERPGDSTSGAWKNFDTSLTNIHNKLWAYNWRIVGQDYTDFNTAVSTINSTECTLVIFDNQTLTANVTVPSTLHIFFMKGGKISLGNYNITINGNLTAKRFQIFDISGSGSVTFGEQAIAEVYPEWWGAIADNSTDCEPGINAANDSLGARGGKISLGRGIYVVGSKLKIGASTIGRSIMLAGCGPVATIIKGNLTTAIIESPDTAQAHQRNVFRDFNISNTTIDNAGGIGINLAGQYLTKIDNVRISEVETGIYIDKYYNEMYGLEIKTVGTGIKLTGTRANENKILYGRISVCTTGIDVDEAYNTDIMGIAIENATTGIILNDYEAKVIGCLFDTMTTGISITASGVNNILIGNTYPSCTTKVSDSGTNTQQYESDGKFQVTASGIITKDTRTKEFFVAPHCFTSFRNSSGDILVTTMINSLWVDYYFDPLLLIPHSCLLCISFDC